MAGGGIVILETCPSLPTAAFSSIHYWPISQHKAHRYQHSSEQNIKTTGGDVGKEGGQHQ
jgi:hypothetical protein